MSRPGLTPDDFSRGREVGEGLQSFQPQTFWRAKSKERPLSGDRSFNLLIGPYEGKPYSSKFGDAKIRSLSISYMYRDANSAR